MTTWRKEIERELPPGEAILESVGIDLDERFVQGHGVLWDNAPAFTAWSETRVYFPVGGGAGNFWLGSAPRNPCGEALQPQGDW